MQQLVKELTEQQQAAGAYAASKVSSVRPVACVWGGEMAVPCHLGWVSGAAAGRAAAGGWARGCQQGKALVGLLGDRGVGA